ncbi:MAG: RNA polymerase factor sigma-54 [Kiritimatiellae bacterium]|nr:RNA polymerase factor sigma-54 [Kiritimatiellia bacterium]
METSFRQGQRQSQGQRQILAPQVRQGLKLLEMDIGDLRTELYREMSQNPLFEDVEHPIDNHTTGEIERESRESAQNEDAGWPDDEEGVDQQVFSATADDIERRQHFFDSRTQPETLEEHLRKQLGMAGLDDEKRALAETLIGYLDADGRFIGSLADIQMVTGENEKSIREVLGVISTLDPPGCGTVSLKECLLAQTDSLEEPFRGEVREIIQNHLEDVAKGDLTAIEKAVGISGERLEEDLATLRSLEPRPGRAFCPVTESPSYVNPEVHAVHENGKWVAKVDEKDLPDIKISKRYVDMLANPSTSPEVRAYIKEKIAAIEAIREAISRRYDTIRSISQAIFDAQEGFFTNGPKALRALTMREIAEKAGVHHTTVSRTVNGKYASTPFGTVELRSFFVAGVALDDGGTASKNTVMDRLKAIIASEDASKPLSDEKIAALLSAEGFKVARRTVAKYRTILSIPGAAERRS